MPDPRVFEVTEKTAGRLTATLVDQDGVTPIPSAALVTFTLHLYAIKTDGTIAVINSRTHQNVLNANNVTITAGGVVTWSYQVADVTLVEGLPYERHIALFEWTTASIGGKQEVVLNVRNLLEVS
jgi:hypothetical protein